ncbi:MAG: hypothetical protein U0802_21235 [Candidatus Binatia bacterium]
MPTDHPRFLGMVGMHAARYTNLALEECDLPDRARDSLRRPRDWQGGGVLSAAEILHVDIDPSELGKIKQPLLGIEAEVGACLRALRPHITPRRRAGWSRRIAALRGVAAGDARGG